MSLTFCCICHAETPMVDVDADQLFAASTLTVCPDCDARVNAQRACDICQGHGWIISTSSEWGTTVEKCDTCAVFHDDFAAATAALAALDAMRAPADDVRNAAAADTSACEAFISAVIHDRGIR